MNIKRITHLFALPLLMLGLHSTYAQPIMIPGFMGIESSYMDAPAGSDSGNAYFTISNFHYEPIVLLSASGNVFGNATFLGPNNDELDQLVIQPGERLVMGPDSVYMHLSDLQASDGEEPSQQITLLVRRGLEADEEIEATTGFGGLSGSRTREAGIPNEKEYVVNVPVKY
jgi:copper(I)-binding protein